MKAPLRTPSGAEEREAERFRLAYQKLQRTERRMRRAMLAWLRATAAMQGVERRAARRIGGEYDPRELADLSRHAR